MRVAVVVLGLLLALLAVVLLIVGVRRSPRPEPVETSGTAVDRRRFLNRTLFGSLTLFVIALGAGSAGFLWPQKLRGFGGRFVVGKRDQLLDDLKRSGRPIYNVEGRFYLIHYTGDDPEFYAGAGALASGLMAISQKCSHLGCRVPYCPTSGWFECPCHSARFNGAGERMTGVASGAGMWRFPIEIDHDDNVVVDTSRRIAQPPLGFDSMKQSPRGAFCIAD